MRYFNKLDMAIEHFQNDSLIFARDVIKSNNFFTKKSNNFLTKKSDNFLTKKFYVFDNEQEFLDLTADGVDVNFYEVIDGWQRLYMDVDIAPVIPDVDEAIEDLVNYVKSQYNTRVHVYTSHRPTKQSFHIILMDVTVLDNVQCKYRIIELLNGYDDKFNIKQYIDLKVYRVHQQLRLLGSSKINVDNTKIPWQNTPNTLSDSYVGRNIPNNTVILEELDIDYHNPEEKIGFYARRAFKVIRPKLVTLEDSDIEEENC